MPSSCWRPSNDTVAGCWLAASAALHCMLTLCQLEIWSTRCRLPSPSPVLQREIMDSRHAVRCTAQQCTGRQPLPDKHAACVAPLWRHHTRCGELASSVCAPCPTFCSLNLNCWGSRWPPCGETGAQGAERGGGRWFTLEPPLVRCNYWNSIGGVTYK